MDPRPMGPNEIDDLAPDRASTLLTDHPITG